MTYVVTYNGDPMVHIDGSQTYVVVETVPDCLKVEVSGSQGGLDGVYNWDWATRVYKNGNNQIAYFNNAWHLGGGEYVYVKYADFLDASGTYAESFPNYNASTCEVTNKYT